MNPLGRSCRLASEISSLFFGVVSVFLVSHSVFLLPRAVAATVQSVEPSDTEVMLQAIEATPPLPASDVPRFGNFYSAQFGDQWPPLPGNMLDLPCWPLGDGHYLVDDRDVDYDALRVAAEEDALLSASRDDFSMMMAASSLLNAYVSYGNSPYLTNMTATFDGSAMIASFSVAGGTNFVPYDILTSTNVADPVSDWNWLGVGYTSNSYSFSGQPLDMAFYILAKPERTMVVGWGNDDVGQCDVPWGVTNALRVAGGGGQSLALLTDGSVVAWGQNAYGQASVPTNVTGATMVSAGWYHDVALLTNGSVLAWGLNLHGIYNLTEVPAGLTNATIISAQALHSLALKDDGTIVAWGYGPNGEASVPSGVSNVVAIAAGHQFNVVAKVDGTVSAWGNNSYGQCNVPAGLSNVVDVAAGPYHSLALLNNGTVVAWGDGSDGETNVPPGLTNVVAIAASGDPYTDTAYSLALKSDGTIVAWGYSEVVDAVDGMTNVIAIAGGGDHALAVRTGPRTPVITLEPFDQFQIAGGNVTFESRGAGVYGVSYQWQSNSVAIVGQTNASLWLTNVQVPMQGVAYSVRISNEVGSIVSSNALLQLVGPPVIISQSPMPTNPVVVFQENLTLAVVAAGTGQLNGYPLTFQWQFNGTNISGATSTNYTILGDLDAGGTYSVIVSNAAGFATANWHVSVTYSGSYIDVGTLAYHLSTNAVARTNGISDIYNSTKELSGWVYDLFSGTNMVHLTNSVWSTNFWLYGVSGLSATSIGISNSLAAQGSVTMISPRHCIYATHMHLAPGYFRAAFLDTNNVIFWRTNMQNVVVSEDISLGILDSDLPASVGFLPVLPTNYTRYLPTNGFSTVQGIGRNQDTRMFGQPMRFTPSGLSWAVSNTAPFGLTTNWNVLIRGGDSSNPEMLLIGSQLISVSHNWTFQSGPNYASYLALINQYMHYLSTNNGVGTDYQLTEASLTNWPVINP